MIITVIVITRQQNKSYYLHCCFFLWGSIMYIYSNKKKNNLNVSIVPSVTVTHDCIIISYHSSFILLPSSTLSSIHFHSFSFTFYLFIFLFYVSFRTLIFHHNQTSTRNLSRTTHHTKPKTIRPDRHVICNESLLI